MTNKNTQIETIRENASLGCLSWRNWSELDMHFDKNSFWFTSEIKSPIFNTIVELDPNSPICDSYLTSIAEQLEVKDTPLAWMIPGENKPESNMLLEHSFYYVGSTRGMIKDLTDYTPTEKTSHKTQIVTSDDDLYDWTKVICKSYTFTPECRYPWYDMHKSIGYGKDNLWEHFIIREGDIAVAACSLFWGPDAPSLANVAVIPEAKGKGYGTAIIERALSHAQDVMDPELITLYATEEAFHLYQKLGFEQICSTDIYQRAQTLH